MRLGAVVCRHSAAKLALLSEPRPTSSPSSNWKIAGSNLFHSNPNKNNPVVAEPCAKRQTSASSEVKGLELQISDPAFPFAAFSLCCLQQLCCTSCCEGARLVFFSAQLSSCTTTNQVVARCSSESQISDLSRIIERCSSSSKPPREEKYIIGYQF